MAVRQEIPVSYKTNIKTTLVEALRDVFTTVYADPQFQSLRVTTEFPLTRDAWPAVYIRYNEGKVTNAGVAHEELFQDNLGYLRRWMHRHFEGSIEFVICALSPYDRDILADALVEILSFNQLSTAWLPWFNRIYGNPNVPFSVLNILHQVSMNTDEIQGGSENVSLAPWEPEDVLIYTSSYQVEVTGGFYNSIPTNTGVAFISSVDVEPYIEVPPFAEGNTPWVFPFLYEDDAIVTGRAKSVGHEGDPADDATVIGKAQVSSIDSLSSAPFGSTVIGVAVVSSDDGYSPQGLAGTVTGVAHPSAVIADLYNDTATVQSVAVPSSSNGGIFVDAATVTAIAKPSAIEEFVDTATVTSIAVVSDTEGLDTLDADTATAVAVPSADDEKGPFDTDTAIAIALPSGEDNGDINDNASVIAVAVPSAYIPVDYIDTGTMASVAVPSSIDNGTFNDSDPVVTSIALPSADDGKNDEFGTVTGVAVCSSTDSQGADDAATEIATAFPTATDVYLPDFTSELGARNTFFEPGSA